MKLGSFVKEEAICSANSFWKSEELNFISWAWLQLVLPNILVAVVGVGLSFTMLLGLGFARSSATVGPDEPRVGTEARLTHLPEPDPGVDSCWVGGGWLCSPS